MECVCQCRTKLHVPGDPQSVLLANAATTNFGLEEDLAQKEKRERVTWCFTPSQPVWIYQTERESITSRESRAGERERQRQRDTESETDRETEKDRQTDKETDRQTDRQRDRQIDRQTDNETEE